MPDPRVTPRHFRTFLEGARPHGVVARDLSEGAPGAMTPAMTPAMTRPL